MLDWILDSVPGKKLDEGRKYFFKVYARNEKGLSEPTMNRQPIEMKDVTIQPSLDLRAYTSAGLVRRFNETVVIRIPFEGLPRPTLRWLKDDEVMEPTTRIVSDVADGNIALLTIQESVRSDTAKYSLVATNAAGTPMAPRVGGDLGLRGDRGAVC